MGTTNRLMAARYSGKAQLAVARWRSSAFSTTSTWNMRGKVRMAAADRKISPAQRSGCICHSAAGEASIRALMSAGPSATNHTTNTPTASKATSLTMASTAMAVTTP